MTNITKGNTNMTNINITDKNKQQLVSQMATELYHNGLTKPGHGLRVAMAYIGSVDYYLDGGMTDFQEAFIDGLLGVKVIASKIVPKGEDKVQVTLDDEFVSWEIEQALESGGYLDGDKLGSRLGELCNLTTTAYAPALASEGVTRRFNYSQVGTSPLLLESIHTQEANKFSVCAWMLQIANQVAGMEDAMEDKEAYVLEGCNNMDSKLAYVSEFKADRRGGRTYQAACHGPQGASSDRSRALQDLFGVPLDYDVDVVKKALKAEVMDMVTCSPKAVGKLMGEACTNPAKFIVKYQDSKIIKKPWSFTKASIIWKELMAGNKPYIGMAVGLDAKCSGPQLASLMVGDQTIAAACGFSLEKVEDAYNIAVRRLEDAGFAGFTRDVVKDPYMGIFYGQSYQAFTNITKMRKEGQDTVIELLYPDGIVSDDRAKLFHKTIEKSFGSKMINLRNMIKSFGDATKGRTTYFLPDGAECAMNYKVQLNVLGEEAGFDTDRYDVEVRNDSSIDSMKFIDWKITTKQVSEKEFARTGFVNLVQAVDALLARLIISNLSRLGAKHVIGVHDCFRVNVTEMHLLEEAIKLSYHALFGTRTNIKTKDMPLGLDILGLYFEGVNKVLKDSEDEVKVSQFFTSGTRKMTKVNGVQVKELINSLGTTYYFAK